MSASPSSPSSSPDLYLTIRSANAQQLSAALLKVAGDATALNALSAPLIKGWLFEMRDNVDPSDQRIAMLGIFECVFRMRGGNEEPCFLELHDAWTDSAPPRGPHLGALVTVAAARAASAAASA